MFPLLFLFVFGGIFGRSSSVSFSVALLNQSNTQFADTFVKEAKKSKLLTIDNSITTLAAAEERMSRGA